MQLTKALAKAINSVLGFSDNFPPNYLDAF